MNERMTLLEEIILKPAMVRTIATIFILGTIGGLMYDAISGSLVGLVFDAIFLVLLSATILHAYRSKKGFYLPLAIALYEVIGSFTLDIVSSVIEKDPHVTTKVPIEIALIAMISIAIGLFMPRILILINGLFAGALFMFYALSLHDPYLVQFSALVLPTLVGSALAQFHFRSVVNKLLVQLYGDSKEKPQLDLNARKITPAEFACITLLLKGKTTKEIAGAEKCSESAIQARLGSIYKKLDVPDRQMLMYVLGHSTIQWQKPKPTAQSPAAALGAGGPEATAPAGTVADRTEEAARRP